MKFDSIDYLSKTLDLKNLVSILPLGALGTCVKYQVLSIFSFLGQARRDQMANPIFTFNGSYDSV